MKNILYILFYFLIYSAQSQSHPGLKAYDEGFAQKLVQVALANNPENEAAERSVKAAEYNVKLSAMEWLNTLRFTGNINEFNIDPERDVYNRSQFLPRYNLSASISLGMFFTIPYATRQSREELRVTESMARAHDLTLEASVLRQYHTYIMELKIFKLHEELLMDTENNLKLTEERFTTGEVTFDEYSQARSEHNNNLVTYYRAEAALRNARVSLEELVGQKLENIY